MRTRWIFLSLLLLVTKDEVTARPAVDEAPIKFTLDTSGKAEDKTDPEKPLNVEVGSTIQSGMEWLGRMADALRFGRGRLVNSVAIARNYIAERVEELMSETRNNVAGAIGAANDIAAVIKSRSGGSISDAGTSTSKPSYERAPFAQFLPPKTRETVRLETEDDQAFFERKKTNPLSSLLESILKPKPIVDNLKEEEKYGNNGDKFIGVGRALVNGFEGLSNFLNAVVDLPVNAAKKTSRNITEALNQIGSRLIGLQ